MPSVLAYHRPTSLDEAQSLVAGGNRRLIGGGTVVVPESLRPSDDGIELVDLQAVGLDGIGPGAESITVGAMVRLGQLADDDRVPDLLRQLARRELPSALRNQATVGGTVALAEPDSLLLAGLLVHAATVGHHGAGRSTLAEVLAVGVGSDIVTDIEIEAGGRGAAATTGRTPSDVPIVAAVARTAGGERRLALTGVAPTAILVDPDAPTARLDPPSDFRGSSDYRLHLAAVLAERVLAEVAS